MMSTAGEMLPNVYQELRQLAASKMAREWRDQTLQPTALVHEAWMKVAASEATWERTSFFRAAAHAMRQILIDKARQKLATKRGGGRANEELFESQIVLEAPAEELLALNEALDRLAAEDDQAAELVQLRYFVGFNMQEAADAMGISVRSAHRVWVFAKAWLKRELNEELGSSWQSE